MPIAELTDVEIHYEERGQGPPLLLVAGIPALASDWWPFADRLTARRRAIAYDNRGSGDSTVTAGPYTTAQLAADAIALLDHLGIERTDVFGMSLGGMIAQEIALAWPDRVRRLVLGCTQASFGDSAKPGREVRRAFAVQTDTWAERICGLAPFAFATTASPTIVEQLIAKKVRDVQTPEGYRAQIAAALSHDALERLAQIASPTLVVTGDDDQVVPASNSRVLAEHIPGATLRVIDNAGHLFFLERPEETQRVLEAFLS